MVFLVAAACAVAVAIVTLGRRGEDAQSRLDPPPAPEAIGPSEDVGDPSPGPSSDPAAVAESGLRLLPGYPLCESGGQLRWFIDAATITELYDPKPPNWQMEVHLSGSRYSRSEASRAYQRGWCVTSDDMDAFTVEILEDCQASLPMPNGGCTRIRVRPVRSTNWTNWYTFGSAVSG